MRHKRTVTWRTIAYIFLPIVFLTLGGVGTYNAANEWRESRFVLIEGESLGSAIVLVRGRTRDTTARSGAGDRWMLKVNYRYTVDGTVYESDRMGLQQYFALAETRTPPQWLQALEQSYAEGNTIDVWVSPNTPERSALVRAKGTWILPLSAAVVALFLFWLTLRGRHRARRQEMA